MSPRLLLFLCIALGVAGQLLIKGGINSVRHDGMAVVALLVKSFLNPLVISGFLLYAVSALMWIVVLSKVELSVAYPALSVGYILILFFSWKFLSEPITWTKAAGVAFILVGVTLLFAKR